MRSVYYREEFILDNVRNMETLSIGLGGQTEDTSYSFNLSKTSDVSFTVSAKIAAAAKKTDFIDISEKAIQLFSSQLATSNYFHVDITSPFECWPDSLREMRYEVIVLGEVLEHIDNPGLALANLKRLLKPSGKLIITVPNAFFISGFIKTLLGNESIHQEHVCYYSPATIIRLVENAGLKANQVAWARWSRFEWSWLTHRLTHVIAHVASLLFPQVSESVVLSASLADSQG